ncbi:hypothetical protein [Bradyrhizobium diazoefficiens]
MFSFLARRLVLAATLAVLPAVASAQMAITAPTPPTSENNNRIATTAWVNNFVGLGLPLASGKIYIGSAGNIATAQTMSGDATLAIGGALTLATVNANVGSFGSATNCISITTNGKGLITAASAATCTPAIASITGLGTGVATALAVNIGSAGSVVVNGGAAGTPSSITLTNGTGLPISTGVSGLGTGIATWLGTPSSANLRTALTDETGTGVAVFGTSPSIATPTLTGLTTGTCANGLGVTAGGAVINVSCPGTSGAAFQSSTALTPTGTSSTSATMAGMGATCKITPTASGRVRFTIEGRASNSIAGSGIALQLLEGTGTAPSNGGAVSGSSPSGLTPILTSASAGSPTFFSVTGQATGLTLGTQVWFDLSQAAFTSGTATISAAACNAMEF